MTSTKLTPALLMSLAALAVAAVTAQAASPKAKISPTAAKAGTDRKAAMKAKQSGHTQAPAKADAFTLSRGTNTLRAILVHAPPVYDPGGPVCFVEEWQGDESLLADAEQTAAERGAVLARVVCVHADKARAELLARRGYTIASEWYTAPLPLADTLHSAHIRRLTAGDVPRVLELGEQKRRQYEAYSPVFWRVSPRPRKTFAPYMQAQIADAQNVALAHERGGRMDGFVLANARGYIDDFMVAAPELWPTVGAEMLRAAGAAAYERGAKSLLIVCGHGDKPKQVMLASQGLTLATGWYVRPLARETR